MFFLSTSLSMKQRYFPFDCIVDSLWSFIKCHWRKKEDSPHTHRQVLSSSVSILVARRRRSIWQAAERKLAQSMQIRFLDGGTKTRPSSFYWDHQLQIANFWLAAKFGRKKPVQIPNAARRACARIMILFPLCLVHYPIC